MGVKKNIGVFALSAKNHLLSEFRGVENFSCLSFRVSQSLTSPPALSRTTVLQIYHALAVPETDLYTCRKSADVTVATADVGWTEILFMFVITPVNLHSRNSPVQMLSWL